MREKDRPRFARALLTLAEVFAESLSGQRIQAYFNVLREYSVDAVERAITQAMRQNKFFPKPVELIDLMAPALANRALLAWHTALDARNPSISVRFEDPIVNEVLRKMGGWVEFCGLDAESRPFRQKEFERLYLAIAALPQHDLCEYLPGSHERSHPGEYGFIPAPGLEMVNDRYVKHATRLNEPRTVHCSYLSNEKLLAEDGAKALGVGDGDSGICT